MSGHVEPPTAPINNSDAIKTLSGIFALHDERIVLFTLAVTFVHVSICCISFSLMRVCVVVNQLTSNC